MKNSELIATFEAELRAISHWWCKHGLDEKHGGFWGRIDDCNRIDRQANKGVIQNARILWYFSEVAKFRGRAQDVACAERAYAYICKHFIDEQYGGVFWELNCRGQVLNGRKQIYAQAFALYAFCAYYRLTGDAQALTYAQQLFELIERYGRDGEQGGYFEAFNREWGSIDDLRLSPKEMNWPKTMNTHLHVLEAYSSLFVTCASDPVEQALHELVTCFDQRFITASGHLRMFMDGNWQDKSDCYSFGHDIECSWLLWEAVEAVGDETLRNALRPRVLRMAEVCVSEGIGSRGELLDAYNFIKGEMNPERVWWVQAEAMVGFLNAYALSGDAAYFATFEGLWRFIQTYQIDREYGEWRWLSSLDESQNHSDHKGGPWKGPYHNGRAMMEVLRRLARVSKRP